MWIPSFLCFILFCFISYAAAKIHEIPFAFQWSIQENRLLPLNDSINGYLQSASVFNFPEFEYYLEIYPNGYTDDHRGQTYIFLWLEFKNVMNVEANFTVTIESTNYARNDHYIYEETVGWGYLVCKTEEFFDAEKKYIVNGKFSLKVNGTFKFENVNTIPAEIDGEQQKWEGSNLGDDLWNDNKTKDFSIIVEDKKIKVHKFILGIRSPYLASMFDDIKKHSNADKNTAVFDNVSFDVVEAGIKIIYDCNFVTSFNLEELILLLHVLDDFRHTYSKAKVELYLIHQISASTVCRLTNASILTNSFKLKEKCMEFLLTAIASKTAISNLRTLDKDILLEVVENSLYQNIDIK